MCACVVSVCMSVYICVWCACMCACLCTCMRVCVVCVHGCVHVCVSVVMSVYACVYMSVLYMCACVLCAGVFVCIHVCWVYVCMCVCVFVCACVRCWRVASLGVGSGVGRLRNVKRFYDMVCRIVGGWRWCVVYEGRADVCPHHRHPTHHFHTHTPLHPSTLWCGRVEAVRVMGWRG